ncbi:transporter [Jinshanibacter sp. LJY008]|uniref:Transporter n=1 Tax=Limnobaculum eriocheiris TaxID=2897391 RepID=A0A9X1MYG0_9GAMM|nr:transporter [Limnobaculum eriocheiris]MCD1126898.1 transporter [Limnobaculum eriocheiris]
MQTELSILYRAIKQFLLYSLAAAISTGMMFLDIKLIGNQLDELSFVEISQETMLFISIILFLSLAWKKADIRYSSILIAGFFICMFIREFDSFLDMIDHGFWIYPSLLVAAICLLYTALNMKSALVQLANFTTSPNYGFMISGLVCILVFSRLFGMKYLWYNLHPDQSRFLMYNIKAAVEEGAELFGYSLCLIASLFYYRENQSSQIKSPSESDN